MSTINKIIDIINNWIWGVPLLASVLFIGIFYSIRLHFVQLVHVKSILKETLGAIFGSKGHNKKKTALSSLHAAMISISAIIGSGNIAGIATAIVIGGPGALFWMWISAFFGMASKFAEIVLGILYQREGKDGRKYGGAMYYLADGLNNKYIGRLFSLLVIPFAFVISGVVDSNTIVGTVSEQYSIRPSLICIPLVFLVAIVIVGGVSKIGQVCTWIAPIMGGTYLVSGLIIILLNYKQIPGAFHLIFNEALNYKAIISGEFGSVFLCMRIGIARGLYSNEAGLGTAAMVHAGADVEHPIQQACWGPVEVFLDTMIVCTISGIAIIISGLWRDGVYDGAYLTMRAFEILLPGKIGGYIVLLAVIIFCFSSLISYYVYAERAFEFLFKQINYRRLKILWLLSIIVGSQSTLGFVWGLADICNAMMIIPNIIGLLLLSNKVVESKDSFWER